MQAIIALGRGVQRRRVLRGRLVKSVVRARLEFMLALKHEHPGSSLWGWPRQADLSEQVFTDDHRQAEAGHGTVTH